MTDIGNIKLIVLEAIQQAGYNTDASRDRSIEWSKDCGAHLKQRYVTCRITFSETSANYYFSEFHIIKIQYCDPKFIEIIKEAIGEQLAQKEANRPS